MFINVNIWVMLIKVQSYTYADANLFRQGCKNKPTRLKKYDNIIIKTF